ncbi:hypothetical protein Hbl1158_04320 [Halobaculum sp. CBA1158]|uniref:hypothetical protein n=1 Tax=Halobaculum sp. CBA1158 TaxID=2904243 RepID=UPI001F1CA350|nr:hypothetical protein [Halobaculum sp. CBA1158]UIP00593.1 hypothetical protein Hbl1158_04320 [Halobaculum sp. CBA1158]
MDIADGSGSPHDILRADLLAAIVTARPSVPVDVTATDRKRNTDSRPRTAVTPEISLGGADAE